MIQHFLPHPVLLSSYFFLEAQESFLAGQDGMQGIKSDSAARQTPHQLYSGPLVQYLKASTELPKICILSKK